MLALSLAVLPLALIAPADAVDQPVGNATATVETQPVTHSGDAADDPAIWRHPTDPSQSIVIGNDKGGALDVYNLAGTRIQQFTGNFFGNVDVRYAVPTGAGPRDVAVTYFQGIRVYAIDPVTRRLSNITDHSSGSLPSSIGGEGICLYRSPVDNAVYVYVNNRNGVIAQQRLTDNDGDGLIEGSVVRQWDVGLEIEGCVADDELGHLYISEEVVGIWKYGAEPSAGTAPANRVSVDRTTTGGGRINADAEGLTIVYQPGGTGYLIASSQAASDTNNSYLVYERQGNNTWLRRFQVVSGTQADNCGRTDGIDALAADLGPAFPYGVFICQDNQNSAPLAGFQNFKLVPLERVVGIETEPVPDPPVASLDVSCVQLACTMDGRGSSDPDGDLTSYEWTFGDGSTGEGSLLDHAYDEPGTYLVTLTVTDAGGLSDTASESVQVTDAVSAISFVGQATANANALAHRVTVPAAVQAGDALLLALSVNTSATIGAPSGVTGWTQVGSVQVGGGGTRVWKKVATSADAGQQVQVSLSAQSKGNLTVLAYRGTSATDPVAAFSALPDPNRTSHATPVVATSPTAWVVSYWAHKDSTTTPLSPPAGVAVRATGTQSGSGSVKTLAADSNGPVAGSSYGGLVATAGASGSFANVWSIALSPG